MILFDNPFSPFTRKVRLVLHYKGIPYQSVDGLALENLEALREKNPRGEVPVLTDEDFVVVDSKDIVDYLEDVRPEPTIYPVGARARARARHWQRLADHAIDAILHDISLWMWPTHRRSDSPPAGLLEAGRRDLAAILGELERELGDQEFICGALSIADFALFPHFPSLRVLGVALDPERHPQLERWERRMRTLEPVRQDLKHAREALQEKFRGGSSPYEPNAVIWRGDRIEWLLSKGFDAWWSGERASGTAVVPDAVAEGAVNSLPGAHT